MTEQKVFYSYRELQEAIEKRKNKEGSPYKETYVFLAGDYSEFARWCRRYRVSYSHLTVSTGGWIPQDLRDELKKMGRYSVVLFDNWPYAEDYDILATEEVVRGAERVYHTDEVKPRTLSGEISEWVAIDKRKEREKSFEKPLSVRFSADEIRKIYAILEFLQKKDDTASLSTALRFMAQTYDISVLT